MRLLASAVGLFEDAEDLLKHAHDLLNAARVARAKRLARDVAHVEALLQERTGERVHDQLCVRLVVGQALGHAHDVLEAELEELLVQRDAHGRDARHEVLEPGELARAEADFLQQRVRLAQHARFVGGICCYC